MDTLTFTITTINHCVYGKLWSKYADFIEKSCKSEATSIFFDWLYDEIFDGIQNMSPEIRPLLREFVEIIIDEIDVKSLDVAAIEKFKEQKKDSWRVI